MVVTFINHIEELNLKAVRRITPKRPKIKLELDERRNIIPSEFKKTLVQNGF
jgi:hypothetical protein